MNRLKQVFCILLTFAVAGGCAKIKTVNVTAETTTVYVSEYSFSETAEITAETTAVQTSDSTTVKVTEKSVTQTVTQPTTAKPTTTKIPETETTTSVPATRYVTTTVTQTVTQTLPVQSGDSVVIGLKRIDFGADKQKIIGLLGNPTETVTENLIDGGTVTSLIYADDYREFAVFRLLNGRFFGFYTCVKNTFVTDGSKSYSIRTGGEKQIGNVSVTEYADSKNGGRVYAFKAGFNGFDYTPSELENLDGQERLIFHITNAIRAINGIPALEYSHKAADCVRKHCKDMSARNYFSHDTPEGVTSAQRLKNGGVEYTKCGENLAAGRQDAFGLAHGWYNSSGHRNNMLEKDFNYLGTGVVRGNESYPLYAGQNYYK
ncbi:MAG: CAP domain-containing protein [Ruminococcaceae bacterium]|nr:CAP domain-containing protein [Oscillospiraceae bacterium]